MKLLTLPIATVRSSKFDINIGNYLVGVLIISKKIMTAKASAKLM